MNKIKIIAKTILFAITISHYNLIAQAEIDENFNQTVLEEFELVIKKHRNQFEADVRKHREQFEKDIIKYTEVYMHKCVGSETLQKIKKTVEEKINSKEKEEETTSTTTLYANIAQNTHNHVKILDYNWDYNTELIKFRTPEIYYGYAAAETNDIAAMQYAIKLGLDINENRPLIDGTVLEIAVNKGHTEIVKWLLDNDFNIQAWFNQKSLITAIQKGHLDIVKLLVHAGISTIFDHPDKHHTKITLVEFAKEQKQFKIAEWYDNLTNTQEKNL